MRTTKSVVVARTDEMKIPSGRENKREAMSKLPIDETILAMWQRHNSSMAVYQRITRLSKQATSLNVGKSHFSLAKNNMLAYLPLGHVFASFLTGNFLFIMTRLITLL
jgi:hypothetical protein